MLGLSEEALAGAVAGATISRTVLRSDVLRIVRGEPVDVILLSSLAGFLFSADFLAAHAARTTSVAVLVVARLPDVSSLIRLRAAGVPAETIQPPVGAEGLRERIAAALRSRPTNPPRRAQQQAIDGPPGAIAAVTPTPGNLATSGVHDMANITKTLEEAMKIDGAIAVALADWDSGLCLGTAGGGARLNVEVAAAGNCQVVKAKMATMNELGIKGAIHDILITLDDQVHLIRPLRRGESLFLYVAIDKAKGNLGMARHKVQKLEAELNV